MNRKERKSVEKQMELDKFYKNMTQAQKWKRMSDNIENGRRMMEDTKKRVILEQENQEIEKMNNAIASRAEIISKQTKIPYMDALELAKNEYTKLKR